MNCGNEVLRHEKLVDALAQDILDVADPEILASHAPGAARVVAGCLRQALQRAIIGAAESPEPPRATPRGHRVQPIRDDEERR